MALLTSLWTAAVPQAIEVISEPEQQGLANLRCQMAPRSARGKFPFDHREDGFNLGAGRILFPWKSPVHLATDSSSGEAPAKVRRDDATRAQALPNVLMVGFGVELRIGQHQGEAHVRWRHSATRA